MAKTDPTSLVEDVAIAAFRVIAILFMAFIAAMPWGLGETASFSLPMLGAALVAHWAVRDGRGAPLLIVFLAGLVLDTLTNNPLGYWSLLFLVAAGVASRFGAITGVLAWARRLLVVALALTITGAVGWGVASLYFAKMLEVMPMLWGTALAAAGAIPLVLLVDAIETSAIRRPLAALGEEA